MLKPPAVELKPIAERPGKPPMITFELEVILRNEGAEPRWFVVPSNLPAATGGIDVLEVFGLGDGVILGRFLGTGGFWALLLPAKAEVRIKKLPLIYWDDPQKKLTVEVTVARELTLGGERGADVVSFEPTLLC